MLWTRRAAMAGGRLDEWSLRRVAIDRMAQERVAHVLLKVNFLPSFHVRTLGSAINHSYSSRPPFLEIPSSKTTTQPWNFSTAQDTSNLICCAIAASDARIVTFVVDTASTGQAEQAGP